VIKGDALRRIRTERGMGQSALAKAAGVRPTIISNLENGYAAGSKYLPKIPVALEFALSNLLLLLNYSRKLPKRGKRG
jgi:DNA-binding XRE family transcriptional regulator